MNIEEEIMYYVIFYRGFLIVTRLSYFFLVIMSLNFWLYYNNIFVLNLFYR